VPFGNTGSAIKRRRQPTGELILMGDDASVSAETLHYVEVCLAT
jgi:hypothetical protein